MKCKFCGSTFSEDSSVCPSCGAKISAITKKQNGTTFVNQHVESKKSESVKISEQEKINLKKNLQNMKSDDATDRGTSKKSNDFFEKNGEKIWKSASIIIFIINCVFLVASLILIGDGVSFELFISKYISKYVIFLVVISLPMLVFSLIIVSMDITKLKLIITIGLSIVIIANFICFGILCC